jgi:hypothetical protein
LDLAIQQCHQQIVDDAHVLTSASAAPIDSAPMRKTCTPASAKT